MSSLSWWRSWHGAPTDHKWPVIAARSGVKVGVVSAIAWALFDYASQQPDRGSIDGFDTETYAVYSGFPEEEVKAVIQAMIDKGIITNSRLANWEKRQPKREDDSAERVRKYRELKRDVTQGNADDNAETPQIKSTDTDTESDKEAEAEPPRLLDIDFGTLCESYHANIGTISSITRDMLKDDLEEYGLQWCLDAIQESVANNVRRWSYARAILERWKTDGRGNKSKKTTPAPAPAIYTPEPEPPGGWLKPDPERSRKLLAQVEEIARQKREALNGTTS